MENIDFKPFIQAKFPLLDHPELLDLLQMHCSFKTLDAGDILIKPGQIIQGIPLVISGLIRIVKFDQHEREVFLYFLEEGHTCAMSLTCCGINAYSTIQALAEEETECIWIPIELLDTLYTRFQAWRMFMSNTYSSRFQELFEVVEEMAFNKLDSRLEHYLLKLGEKKQTQTLDITHAQIAKDLNTSREVISRLLKTLEKTGFLVLGRNKIRLMNND